MGDDIRRGPKTFFLNNSQPQGRPLLSPFLEPGLASLKSEHPPALSKWVSLLGERGQCSPAE